MFLFYFSSQSFKAVFAQGSILKKLFLEIKQSFPETFNLSILWFFVYFKTIKLYNTKFILIGISL